MPRPQRVASAIATFVVAFVCTTLVAAQATGLRALVGSTSTGQVTRVVDGDTFDVRLDGRDTIVRVRIFGIDAPERGEPYSNVALRQARVLLVDQRVSLEGRDVDRYGRLVAVVTASGRDVGAALIEAGLACHYTQYSSEPSLTEAERSARARGVGFWAPGAPRPRCATRGASASAPGGGAESTRGLVASGPFHGNRNSHVYHAPHCRNYHCKNCTRVFTSEAEAQGAGFRPAQDCLRR